MDSSFDSLVVVQSAMAGYRRNFAVELHRRTNQKLQLVVGDESFGTGVKTSMVDPDLPLKYTTNRYFLGRRVMWQSGALAPAIHADVAVIEMNPRILNTWLVLAVRRLRRRRTLLWGHVWSRGGRTSWTNRIRLLHFKIADGAILYTQSECDELLEVAPTTQVWSANNAVFNAEQIEPAPDEITTPTFVISGRLIAPKKVELALQALASVGRTDLRLAVIGAGPLETDLRRAASRLGIADRVDFFGELYDHSQLKSIYARSLASISSGYVGLSMTQSHAFGRPMIYADDEPHAPEIEGAIDGFNATSFHSDDTEGLARAMNDMVNHEMEWRERFAEISATCRERYSVEAMVSGFLAAISDDAI
jgi:glycosyltransferase involved in cell wall biosynthesis